MKITKYHQSCLLIETKGNRILIDPGTIGYQNEVETDWTEIDYILITHKHPDHCYDEVINQLIDRDQALVFTTNEVITNHHLKDAIVIKEGDIVPIGGIYIEVVHADHGTMAGKPPHAGVEENVGFMIDDVQTRLYVTSDSVSFDQNYECDVIAMPFNGNGLTFGLEDGVAFAKKTKAKMILPIHLEHPIEFMNPKKEDLSKALSRTQISYQILDYKETIEI